MLVVDGGHGFHPLVVGHRGNGLHSLVVVDRRNGFHPLVVGSGGHDDRTVGCLDSVSVHGWGVGDDRTGGASVAGRRTEDTG